MGGLATVVLFGLACPAPCGVNAKAVAEIDQLTIEYFGRRGFAVKPPPKEAKRPTGSEADVEEADVAERLSAERVVVLDLERPLKKNKGKRRLWVTHFLRGTSGPWAVDKVSCEMADDLLSCMQLQEALGRGLRPRMATDVDVVSLLRRQAKRVSRCVAQEDKVEIAQRIFGRLDLDLKVLPTGVVQLETIAPARVAKSQLGRCLKGAMESVNVGPFSGAAIKVRVPVDL